MHDPMTVAFEIRYPWAESRRTLKSGRIRVYRAPFVTVWHVDPETDGSDDSCGFTLPHLTTRNRERLAALAWKEKRHPYFLRSESKEWEGSRTEAEALYRALLLHVAEAVGVTMTFEEAARRASTAIHNPGSGDAASRFCFLPGYHTNFQRDSEDDRERHFLGIVCGMGRWILFDRRPWYRRPRWHVWHWKIQVHPWQKLRRWLFTRCGQCGERLGWSEAGTTYSWSGSGPVFHDRCTTQYEKDSAVARVIRDSQTESATP